MPQETCKATVEVDKNRSASGEILTAILQTSAHLLL